ncbi:MAG TPA: GatB/YqeY domain-containing protein [Pseudomonadaceae bacterium]|nr:GatB/YqeY domain-containing protein [Pseudomonadaceae bacterium]
MADYPIKARIVASMKEAMRARDKARLGTIRLILADFNRIEVDERIEVDDLRAVALLDKMVKQRRESIRQYEAGGRAELAALEQAEIDVIQEFLPAALNEDEIADIIRSAIAESGAADMKAMGAVMNIVRPKLTGRADMSQVSQLVKQLLT